MTSTRLRILLIALVSIALLVVAAPVSAAQAGNPGKGHAKDVVIVGYDEGVPALKRGKAAKSVNAMSSRKLSPLADDTYVMKLPPGQTVEAAIVELEMQDGVAYAEPDYFVHAAETSNDPYFSQMWGMHGDASTPSNQYGSGAAEAWAVGAIGSSDVYVAVLDEGVNTDHEDLALNLDVARSWDALSDDGGVYDGSSYWHGTHVAGTIGARGGNSVGVAGVNWLVKMISVKMLGPEANSGSISNTVAAIDYITALKGGGLNIVAINASWGYQGDPSISLHEAILRAGDAGLLFIAAAGNEGNDIDQADQRFYPAAYDCSTTYGGGPRGWDCLISVANLTQTGGIASSSNYGSTRVDLGAPGESILSTYTSTYASRSGTSMAAPHVTGAVALCASLDPSLGPAAIRDRILSTTITTSSMSETVTGGRLDIGAMATDCRAPVAVPDLVADHKDTVATTLTGVGLSPGSSSTAYDPAITLDHVISSTPMAGTRVAPGSSVDYVVSLGPEPPKAAVPRLIVVDDRSRKFTRRGTGWRQARFGYAKHHFWAPTRAKSAKRIAKWKPTLAAPGTYRIMAKMPRKHATTKRAAYRIKTTNGWVKRIRNQSRRQGRWLDLGVYRLNRLPVVKLTDRTGERTSRGRSVAFDAIKFIPATPRTASPAVVAPPPVAPQDASQRKQAKHGPKPAPTSESPRKSAKQVELSDAKPETAPKSKSSPTQLEVESEPSKSASEQAKSAPGPQPKRNPEPKATRPKAPADSTPKRRAKPLKRVAPPKPAAVQASPTQEPRPAARPEFVLLIVPQELTLMVGESRRIAAFVCGKGGANAGPDEKFGTADDDCTREKNVQWSLKDPAVAVFVEEEGKRKAKWLLLSATTAIDSTMLVAEVGDLTAKASLQVKLAAPAQDVAVPRADVDGSQDV